MELYMQVIVARHDVALQGLPEDTPIVTDIRDLWKLSLLEHTRK